MRNDDLSYLYTSARVHVLSTTVLPWEMIEQMARAPSAEEAQKLMRESDKNFEEQEDVSRAMEQEKARLFLSLEPGDHVKKIIELFQIPYDCHNAKVLLKQQLLKLEPVDQLLSPCGSITADKLAEAVKTEQYGVLPQWLREGIVEGKRMWTESRNIQLLDVALDRASFVGRDRTAKESGYLAAQDYVQLCIDGTNLQILMRMKNTHPEVVEGILLRGGSISAERLLEYRNSGNLSAAFYQEPFRAAIEAQSAARAEEALIKMLAQFSRRCSCAAYGAETLVGFFIQLELRQSAVRFVLAEQKYGRSAGLKERLEVLYG